MNLEITFIIAFFSIIGILLIKDRRNIEFHFGLFIRRWKRGLEFIDTIVKKHRKSLSIAGNVAMVLGIIVGIVGFGTLVFYTLKLQKGAIALVLPTVSGYQIPGPVISIPFWYWIIGAFILIASHETMHAIFSRFEKVPLKNYGILLLLLFPIGAYVEPDEKKMKQVKPSGKIKIFAAGSFANFIVALIVFVIGLLFVLLVSKTLIYSDGVFFNGTIPGYPAYAVNMTGIIKSIDGVYINTTQDLSRVLNSTLIGTKISITTNVSTYEITTVARPDNQTGSFIGISNLQTISEWKPWIKNYSNIFIAFSDLLTWLLILNIGVGTANLLPMKPFDGGLICQEIFIKYFGKKGIIIANVLTIVTIGLILFNLFGTRFIG